MTGSSAVRPAGMKSDPVPGTCWRGTVTTAVGHRSRTVGGEGIASDYGGRRSSRVLGNSGEWMGMRVPGDRCVMSRLFALALFSLVKSG